MNATPDPALEAFLHRSGLAAPGDRPRWERLTGGVSSDIWRVEVNERSFCLKRALPRLRVEADWAVTIERSRYEWAWMLEARRHCPGSVAEPIAHDPELGVIAMAFLDPATHPLWKSELLAGRVDPAAAAAVGERLARLHGATAHRAEVRAQFETTAIFRAIRLDPYLLAVARIYPEHADRLETLVESLETTRVALVHGDVSPKNILLGPAGPVFLDAECAWYGDPAFDLAFCLNHLLLKCLVVPASTGQLLAGFAAMAGTYLAGVTWEARPALEARAARLLPALLLARVDGKSPVEYLGEGPAREVVRDAAMPMLGDPPHRLDAIAGAWSARLSRWRGGPSAP